MAKLKSQKAQLEDARWEKMVEAAKYSDEIDRLEQQLKTKKKAVQQIKYTIAAFEALECS